MSFKVTFSQPINNLIISGSKRARLSMETGTEDDDRDSDSGLEQPMMGKTMSRSRSHSRSRSRSRSNSRNQMAHTVAQATVKTEFCGRKADSSANDSEEGSGEPGTPSPRHTPPLTPALTPQREDTPAPENLSLRKSASPSQTQPSLQAIDLVHQRHTPPPPSLSVSINCFFFKCLVPIRFLENWD